MASVLKVRTWNAQFILDVTAAEPGDAARLAERLCPQCHQATSAGLSAAARDEACHAARCGLRDPARLEDEQIFGLWAYRTLTGPEPPSPTSVATFNERVASAACVTPGLLHEDGRVVLAWAATTLRGELHAALIGAVASITGNNVLNVRELSGDRGKAVITAQRAALGERDRAHARELFGEGKSVNAVAKTLQIDRKTARAWREEFTG